MKDLNKAELVDYIIKSMLDKTENVNSLSEKLGISTRQFDRRYQRDRRHYLSPDTYKAMMQQGYSDIDVARACGYTRQSIRNKKLEWGYMPGKWIRGRAKSTPKAAGLPNIETPWGTAYNYHNRYYLVRIKKDCPVRNHPIAPANQALLHRLVMWDYLVKNNPTSEFLSKTPTGETIIHPLCHIHHKDGDHANNAVENLEPMWKWNHRIHHIQEHYSLK